MTDHDPLAVPYRERERSVTMERMDEQPVSGTEALVEGDRHDELFTLNIGPHHPATHGVLRLLTTLEGEVVRDIKPIIGYVHTGIEKSCEDQQYWKVITFVERMDYLAYYFNATAYCMTVEKLLDEEVPPRAQWLRVIHMELNRIASHLFALATGALDLGAITMLWWGCRDRDLVLDLFEMSSGQRMHPRYIQVGGVFEDIPPGWEQKVREFLAIMPTRLDQYEDLLDRNEIWLERLKGTGIISQERALELGVTGPLLRATGHAWDLRKAMPYSGYEQFEFDVPVGHVGDNYDRFKVRMDEMRQSLRIVEQGLDGLPEGPYITSNRKVALPPRHELATSMEALIHHFKLVTEGFRVPPGESYVAIESPRGELGCYVLADGSSKPARVHMRDPSFVNLQSLPDMARDSLIADFIACVAMLDPILGGIDR
ncbi:MAG: NADH-quinone oxidoreductase subunit [Thermoleophilaceae bacterium]|jgi:NADH-quinone oxidoreductase subunit D|nr:NADH-quinone oxidoreductase subunit [Thermoleophilaceae bacterium]MEA2402383.1 NADH-quinone oxidoreductase subunit [Thermoleophilaceae bacterium]